MYVCILLYTDHLNKYSIVTMSVIVMVWFLSICPNSFIKTQNKIDIFCDAVFVKDLWQAVTYQFCY